MLCERERSNGNFGYRCYFGTEKVILNTRKLILWWNVESKFLTVSCCPLKSIIALYFHKCVIKHVNLREFPESQAFKICKKAQLSRWKPLPASTSPLFAIKATYLCSFFMILIKLRLVFTAAFLSCDFFHRAV